MPALSGRLEARNLTVLRGDRCLFDGLSFTLEGGSLQLLEGQNGSGKTSLLKVLAGLLEPESGEIMYNGSDIRRTRQAYCESLVWMAHRAAFKADLTLVENLRFEAALRPTRPEAIDAVLERLELTRLCKLPFRALSAGQQRRVALARMLLTNVSLWLMDEPFTNLDKAGRKLVQTLVAEHLGRGGLCVMAAHQDVAIDAPIARIQLQ